MLIFAEIVRYVGSWNDTLWPVLTLPDDPRNLKITIFIQKLIFWKPKYEWLSDMKSKYVKNNLNSPIDKIFNIHFLNWF